MTQAMEHNQTTTADAVIDTGAALASAGAFGLFGAVLGRTIGSIGRDSKHNLSGLIGGWLGGITFSVLSLYASFRSREQHERVIGSLREENTRLRAELTGEPIKPVPTAPAVPIPEQPTRHVEAAEHQAVMEEPVRETAL